MVVLGEVNGVVVWGKVWGVSGLVVWGMVEG